MALLPVTGAGSVGGIVADLLEKIPESGSTAESGGSFSEILTKTMETANVTDAADKASALELVSGDVNDLAGVLIDSEKAKIALELTIQIRNKVLDSYDTVMNMQV